MSLTLFHVHTYRCGHAEKISDRAYIEKAFELGATDIWFTDHAPFPGDPFGNRMRYSELDEYLLTLSDLKEEYNGRINIHLGIEVEYFPKYLSYYKELYDRMDILLLGQHMYATNNGYSFQLPSDVLAKEEYTGLGEAMIEGMNTGLFAVCAHPDRIFRKQSIWNSDMEKISMDIINTAIKNNIALEKNISSMHGKNLYWGEFWKLVPNNIHTLIGLDAHFLSGLQLYDL